MAFGNPVVGGNEGDLVRDQIKSPDFVEDVSGWIVRKDGRAQFNDVEIRGDLESANYVSETSGWRLRATTGAAEFNGDVTVNGGTITGGVIQTDDSGERIVLEVVAGNPTIRLYDGTHLDPATIQAYDLGGTGGMVLTAGDVAEESAAVIVGLPNALLSYDNQSGDLESAGVSVGPPGDGIAKMYASSSAAQDLEIGLDQTSTTPDSTPGRIYTVGEGRLNHLSDDGNYPSRVVDGKAPPTTQTTAIGTSDTNISGANVQNTYLQDGFAYRATFHIDYANANSGGRLDFKLWDGAVGGAQLGGINRRWTVVATSSNYGGTVLIFMWRQAGTGISSNLNLSAAKTIVTGSTANVQVNGGYSVTIEQIGDADMIGGL